MRMGGLYWILVLVVICVSISTGDAQIKPIFISCGSNSTTNLDGRKWVGDFVPGNNNFTLTSPGIIAPTNSSDRESTYRSLYQTARIFNTTSSYNFTAIPGSYFLRLHFYPFSFDIFNATDSSFEVRANNLTLVSKFNVPGEILWRNTRRNSNLTSLVKEYFISINGDILEIMFTPGKGSFAFVNAIEVIPVSDEIYVDSVVNRVLESGSNANAPLNLMNRGIETMYRLNVGGPELESSKDLNVSRRWETDERYMFSVEASVAIHNTSNISYASINGSSVAPLQVYETARTMTNTQVAEKKFNISWRFDVDPNFDYLVRLHFCEFAYTKPNERVFKIYINNKTAAGNYDLFVHAKGMNKAYHEDFVDPISQQTDSLWLQLGPADSTNSDSDALLNGLEIFKLGHNGNLAHVLSKIDVNGGQGGGGSKPNSKSLLRAIVIGVVGVLTIIVICACCITGFFIRKKKEDPLGENHPGWRSLFHHTMLGSPTNARALKSPYQANGSMATVRMGKMFMLEEIRTATKNFDESLVIGTGGFGKVFKGEIKGDLMAIKRAHPHSAQGLKEFETEIEMLSKLRHRHLVSMIGYCDEQGEMILIYEYMANGTLRSHLFGSDLPPLTWKQRLEVCIGAARGLHYLHTGTERGIIHRDVKTTNILLDESFTAKVADFGLSKDAPDLDKTHVTTAVKGSFGYLDPEYFRRQQLTQKSDVYSFGVVLFEVICARPVINPSLPKDQISLAEWVLSWQRRQSLEMIVDPNLNGDYSLESLKKFGEIAEKCLADEGRNRPTMGEVLWHLEDVLRLHDYLQSGEVEPLIDGLESMDNSVSLPRVKVGDEESAL